MADERATTEGYVDVGAIEDFDDGKARSVSAGGRDIGVVRWRDEFFALRNICPHQYGPACAGHVMPLLLGEADGTIEVEDDRLVVVCPWHGWEFDARTGRMAWGSTNYRLKAYPVMVQEGRVLVNLGMRARAGKRA